MSDPRGERIVHVSREAMCHALLRDSSKRETSLPNDVRIEELWHNPDGWGYVLRVSSSMWDEMQEGETIPQVDVEVKARYV
jgi:hypothetical protein